MDMHAASRITVRRLGSSDLEEALRIFRLAFGTFVGLPDPLQFMGDADLVGPRWRSNPDAFLGARADGELIGSNCASGWGSVGFFGPLTVRPDWWGRGVAQRLLEPTLALFDEWGTRHVGLFTFPHSPQHVGLYQKFGFWPRTLTAVMASAAAAGEGGAQQYWLLGGKSQSAQDAALAEMRALTGRIYDGLDVSAEARAVLAQGTGDVLVVDDEGGPAAFAVCHFGAGSEGGSGACYLKVAAARPGAGAEARFERLLGACADFAQRQRLARVVGGVNTARGAAYRCMLRRGFRTEILGVTMHRPDDPGYDRPDVFLVDDWR